MPLRCLTLFLAEREHKGNTSNICGHCPWQRQCAASRPQVYCTQVALLLLVSQKYLLWAYQPLPSHPKLTASRGRHLLYITIGKICRLESS